MKLLTCMLVTFALLFPVVHGQDVATVLARLQGEVGDVSTINTLSIEASAGESWTPFETETPEEVIASGSYESTAYMFDLEQDFLRVDMDFKPLFETFVFFPAVNFTRVIRGQVGSLDPGVVFTPNGTMRSLSVASIKRQQMLFNPHLLLRSVDPTTIVYGNTSAGKGDILVLPDDVADIELHVGANGTITKLVTMECNPLSRDVPIEISYSDWSLESNGIKFPKKVEMFLFELKLKIWNEERSAVEVNPTLDPATFDFVGGVTADSATVDAAEYEYGLQCHHAVEAFFHLGFSWTYDTPYGDPVELATGVNFLSGNYANALVLVSTDGVVVVESAGTELVGERLVKRVEGIAGPDAMVTHVIQSHHHMDHSSGVRTMLAANLDANLVVGHNVKEFWEEVLAAPSTIRSDALVEKTYSGMVLEVEEKGSLKVVDNEDMQVTLYHVGEYDPHAEDAVIVEVEVEDEIFVYVADMYNAGFGLTIVIEGPEGFFMAMMSVGIINCACESVSGKSIYVVPAHGVVLPLEGAIAELEGIGVTTGCMPASCKETDQPTNPPNNGQPGDGDTSGAASLPFPSFLSCVVVIISVLTTLA